LSTTDEDTRTRAGGSACSSVSTTHCLTFFYKPLKPLAYRRRRTAAVPGTTILCRCVSTEILNVEYAVKDSYERYIELARLVCQAAWVLWRQLT